jgi:hypothetical protein
MKRNIIYLKDIFGSNYLGIKIQNTEIDPFLNQLRDILGEQYDEYVSNQQKRDDGSYHISVMNVIEYNRLSQELGMDKFINSLDPVLKVEVDDVRLIGVGKVSKNENTSYFVVTRSEILEEVRRKYDLPEKDFHITLGFKHKDVHGVRKNEVLKVNDPFLSRLKKEYYKEGETFEFVKGIKNYDFDFFKLIEPIGINDTTATFRCGDNDYFTISLIDNNFFITAKWQDTEKKPILSDVLINKKFKENVK